MNASGIASPLAEGSEFILVDTAKGTRAPAFDHAKLAAALSSVAGSKTMLAHLPFTEIELAVRRHKSPSTYPASATSAIIAANACADTGTATAGGGGGRSGRGGRGGRGGGGGGGGGPAAEAAPKPCRQMASMPSLSAITTSGARDVASGQETQLTKDGVKDYGYATDNAGWQSSDRPIVVWSPDSKKDRHLPAGSTQGWAKCIWSKTKVGHPNAAGRMEIPATRRQRSHNDSARHNRRRRQ